MVRTFGTATVAAVEGCVIVAAPPFITTVAAVGGCKNLLAVAPSTATRTATVVAVEDCKNLRVVVGASSTASNVSTEACEARLETRLQTRLNKRLDLLSRQDFGR